MNTVCFTKNEKSAHHPSDLHLLNSTSYIPLSLELKQHLPHSSTTISSWKRFLCTCRNKKANKAPEGLPTHKPQEYLWFFPPPAQTVLCVPPGKLQFLLSTHTEKKCKNSINKPRRSGTLLLWHRQAHSFQLLDEKQRQAYGMCTHSQARWTPQRFMTLGPDSPTPL